MRRHRLTDLAADQPHVLAGLLDGDHLSRGGLSFHPPGHRTHPGTQHAHPDHEVFCILAGRGWIEIDGEREPLQAGDVLVIEPGEVHHIEGHPDHPIVNLWLHVADEPHEKQRRP